jgi:hypothetical protein
MNDDLKSQPRSSREPVQAASGRSNSLKAYTAPRLRPLGLVREITLGSRDHTRQKPNG